jgi:hypothetical protein
MSDQNTKKIQPNTACKIIVESDFFLTKYGTSTPKIIIEDLASVVFDSENWWENYNNPAIATFLLRSVMQGITPSDVKNIYYGKIYTDDKNFGLGEIVMDTELEVIKENESK